LAVVDMVSMAYHFNQWPMGNWVDSRCEQLL